MSVRAYARRLVVANWKGIQFHCFDLDRHLTGLQGRNGAGKTTVMASYVTAILPNQRLLNFPNVTGSGQAKSADAGIWGRLGEGVCYAIVEWITPKGKPLWAGVTLMRGSMPHIEIKQFTIDGLPDGISPHEAFLLREGTLLTLPSYTQLREHITLLGARVTTHRTLSDYMRMLYEAGITPLPMMTQEEQSRYYRLLASSMSGSSLGELAKNGLREFLLVEDPGLEKRVSNMRSCLEECRQTKHELDHAQAAHAEISGLYDAAWQMSGYAYFGALGRHEQAQQLWKRQAQSLREKKAAQTQLEEELARLENQTREIELLLNSAREELERKEAVRTNAQKAYKLRAELGWLENDLANCNIRHGRNEETKALAEERERLANEENDAAMAEQSRIASELGDLNQAFEKVARRVTLLRVARERLADARRAIADPRLEPGNALAIKRELDARYTTLTATLTRVESELHAFDSHQSKFERLLTALNRVAAAAGDGEIAPEAAHDFGVRLDERVRENSALAKQVDLLTTALGRSRRLAEQQQMTQQAAKALGIDSCQALEHAIEAAVAEIETLATERRAKESDRSEKLAMLAEAKGWIPGLEELCRQYRNGTEKRRTLAELGVAADQMRDRAEFETNVLAWRQALEALQAGRIAVENEVRQLKEQIRALRNQSGMMDARIGAVAEQLDGTLFATRFDDLSMEDAAVTEAHIGAWSQAIVVSSPKLAAQQAAGFTDRPDTLLFLSEEAATLQRDTQTLGDSEMIEEYLGGIEGVRLTRRPTRPILGWRAREAEIARLEGLLRDQENRLRDQAAESQRLTRVLNAADQLLALGPGAWSGDPEPVLQSERSRERSLNAAVAQLTDTLHTLSGKISETEARKARYQRLQVYKDLLDPPDHRNESARIEKELQAAQAAHAWLAQHEATAQVVLAELPILAKVPQAAERTRLEAEVSRLIETRSILNSQRDALASLEVVLEHFRYEADEEVYETQSSVIASLQRQMEAVQERTRSAALVCQRTREAAKAAIQLAADSLSELTQMRANIVKNMLELRQTGLQGTEAEKEQAQEDYENARKALSDLEKRERELLPKKGECGNALEVAKNSRIDSEREARERLTALHIERRARRELMQALAATKLAGKLDTEANRERFFASGNQIQAFQESRAQAQALLERLKAHPEIQTEVDQLVRDSDRQEERRALQILKVWERVHRHIEQRIPRNIATSDDPQTALAQMRDKMGELRRTLSAQEAQMRTQSVGIAGAIGSRLQTAKRLVRNLNQELANVAFGSIRGVEIKFEDIESMKKVLVALEEHGSGTLFDTEMLLEEALAAIYRRTTNGNIAGAQLLDYRNYLNLWIQVKRISGRWEAASDSLSTGEAIGVGTAILIMVLRTWNEEAKRIHGKGAGQSIQQVLLDEANRLDQEALDTFTDFCQRMDVQALVAAPEIERPRRSTVFILERHFVGNREQVIVRGQRLLA